MIVSLRLFPGKTNDKIFQKIEKKHHFWPNLPIFGQNRIFLKILFLPVFLILNIIVPNLKKRRDTDGRTDGQA